MVLISYLVVLSAVLNVRLSSAVLSGALLDIPLTSLISIGCSECVNSGLTGSVRKTPCSGAYIFYGVQSCSAEVFDVGAYAPAVEVNEQTLFNAPFIFGGTDWQLRSCRPDVSNMTDLSQLDRKSVDTNESRRLRPHQDEGAWKDVVNDEVYRFRKFVYTCPTGRFGF